MDEDGSGQTNLSQEVEWIDVLDEMPEPNNPPEAVDDSADTPQNMAVDIDVLANDSDPDGDALSVASVTDPANGVVLINGDNTIVYTPDADFFGEDTFTYVVSDGRGGMDTATVTVLVVRRLSEEEVVISLPLIMRSP